MATISSQQQERGLGMIFHQPVLLKEAINSLAIKPGQVFIDATLGGGGHTQAIISAGGLVIGIDQDPEALAWAQQQLRSACPVSLRPAQREAIRQTPGFDREPFLIREGNFADMDEIIQTIGVKEVSGVIFDLGTSYYQLTKNKRGFSFESDRLDMRMSPKLSVTAADLLAALSENELYQLFTRFSQEGRAGAIARAIVRARQIKPITSGQQLAQIVSQVYGYSRGKIHPATKTFQALRIAVNDELNNLERGLISAWNWLGKDGRLVVISFHEGEDRIVKQFLKAKKEADQSITIYKKPIQPTEEEIKANPSSRSAKLRAASKK